jgi:DNA-binding response OmpR family regulator
MRQARFNANILSIDACAESLARRTRILRDAGFRVCKKSSGTAALRATSHGHPDVLLLGKTLEGMTPDELCRRIKQRPATCSTMVVAIAGPSEGERIEKLELGADWILCEPVDDDELVATLNTLVKIRWTTEQLRQRVDELELTHPRNGHPRSLSDEISAPLDCIDTWTRILKGDNLERPLVHHGLEAIAHNVALLRRMLNERLPASREPKIP